MGEMGREWERKEKEKSGGVDGVGVRTYGIDVLAASLENEG